MGASLLGNIETAKYVHILTVFYVLIHFWKERGCLQKPWYSTVILYRHLDLTMWHKFKSLTYNTSPVLL